VHFELQDEDFVSEYESTKEDKPVKEEPQNPVLRRST